MSFSKNHLEESIEITKQISAEQIEEMVDHLLIVKKISTHKFAKYYFINLLFCILFFFY